MKINVKATVNLAIIILACIYGREMVVETIKLMPQDNGVIWTINWIFAMIVAVVVFVTTVRRRKNPTIFTTIVPALLTLLSTAILSEMFIHHREVGIKILKETISLHEWIVVAVVIAVIILPVTRIEFEKSIKRLKRQAKRKKEEWQKKKEKKKEEKEAARAAKQEAKRLKMATKG